MKIRSENKYVSAFLGWLFNVKKFEAEFPFHVVRYNNDLEEVDFLNDVLVKFQEHSDSVVRELEDNIAECREENLLRDK